MLDHTKTPTPLHTHTRLRRSRPRGWANTLLAHKYSALNSTLDLLCCLALFAHQMCALHPINTPRPAKEYRPPWSLPSNSTHFTSHPRHKSNQNKYQKRKRTLTSCNCPHTKKYAQKEESHRPTSRRPVHPSHRKQTPTHHKQNKTRKPQKQIQNKGM